MNTYRPCRYCKQTYPACKCKGYRVDARKSSSYISLENWVEGVTIGEMLDYFKEIFQRPDVPIAFSLRITKYEHELMGRDPVVSVPQRREL